MIFRVIFYGPLGTTRAAMYSNVEYTFYFSYFIIH